jgi:mono/diheme cytochrome c family protein
VPIVSGSRALASLALAAAALLGACRQVASAPSSVSGQILYDRHCAACHGVEGRGDGPVAASLRRAPADLTHIRERHAGRFDESYLIAVIDGRQAVAEHGPREMPVWGAVFEEALRGRDAAYPGATAPLQIRALVDHLRSLQATPAPADG